MPQFPPLPLWAALPVSDFPVTFSTINSYNQPLAYNWLYLASTEAFPRFKLLSCDKKALEQNNKRCQLLSVVVDC